MSVDEAVAALERGALVAFPTETVYGLGADASDPAAVAALYAAKRRPADHPVIVHLASIQQLDSVAINVAPWARRLAATCWPGPLTLVVQRRPDAVCDAVTGGRDTVGVRVPDHPVALELLKKFARGVAAPSANRFGKVSPTTAAHVNADFDDEIAIVLDGGACPVGVESTIVDASTDEPRILRVGGVSVERIEAIVGRHVVMMNHGEVAAPGALDAHYSPKCRVELVTSGTIEARARDLVHAGLHVAVLVPSSISAEFPPEVTRLRSPISVDDYAQTLYARLRQADDEATHVLLVIPPEPVGIGAAVIDRLQRAATVSL